MQACRMQQATWLEQSSAAYIVVKRTCAYLLYVMVINTKTPYLIVSNKSSILKFFNITNCYIVLFSQLVGI